MDKGPKKKNEAQLEKPEIYNPLDKGQEEYLTKEAGDLRIASYNILTSRAHVAAPGSPLKDVQLSWNFRKSLILSAIQSVDPDIICFQEVTLEQLRYFQDEMQNFKITGYAERTNKPLSEINDEDFYGEIVPIIYNPSTVKLIDSQVFWLSDTPNEVSKIEGASRPRIIVCAAFHDIKNDTTFVVGNTHYDHIGKEVLLKAGELEAEILQNYSKKFDASDIVYAGDRNCFTGNDYPGAEWYSNFLEKTKAEDVRDCGQHIGLTTTFFGTYKDNYKTPFDHDRDQFEAKTIDHIFHKGSKTVKKSMCSAVEFDIGKQGSSSLLPLFEKVKHPESRNFSSDHALVVVDLAPGKSIKNKK